MSAAEHCAVPIVTHELPPRRTRRMGIGRDVAEETALGSSSTLIKMLSNLVPTSGSSCAVSQEEGGMSAAELRALPVVIHEPPPRRTRRVGPEPDAAEETASDSSSSGGSPRGPKGGGTLKTCAVCIEDYS